MYENPLVAFESAGIDLEGENDPEDMSGEAEETKSMSMEDMLFEHLLDQLIQEKQQSMAYQAKTKDSNTQSLMEADKLRRKLGS